MPQPPFPSLCKITFLFFDIPQDGDFACTCRRMKGDMTIGVVMDHFRPAILEGARVDAREHGILLDGRWSVRADWVPDHIAWDGILAYLVDGKEALDRISALGGPLLHLAGWLGRRTQRSLVRNTMPRQCAACAAVFDRRSQCQADEGSVRFRSHCGCGRAASGDSLAEFVPILSAHRRRDPPAVTH